MSATPSTEVHTIVYHAVSPCRTRTQMFHMTYNGDDLGRSHQPLYDGARLLLSRNVLGSDLMTTRHRDAPYDTWKPVAVDTAALYMVVERDMGGLRKTRWTPNPWAKEKT